MDSHRRSTYPGVTALALSLAACATLPPPNEQIAASRAAIQSAEVAGAAQSAKVELAQAREKLTAAQVAARSNDNERARRLAAEALVDAQLAQTMQKDLEALAAEPTARGVVVTLQDVLFDVAKAQLRSGGVRALERVAGVPENHPERRVLVEG